MKGPPSLKAWAIKVILCSSCKLGENLNHANGVTLVFLVHPGNEYLFPSDFKWYGLLFTAGDRGHDRPMFSGKE